MITWLLLIYIIFFLAVMKNWGKKELFAQRASMMLIIILAFLIVYGLQLFRIQFILKSKYVGLMNKQLISVNKEVGQRGAIYDSNGKKLAFNKRLYTVSINPSLLNDENMLLLQLRGLDKKRSDLLRRSGLEGLTFRQILMQEDSEEAVALLSPILERLSIQAEKLKKVKGGTDRLIRIRMKQLEQRLAGAKQSDPHVYDKYV